MSQEWIPAKVGDVIRKIESHYESDVEDGKYFVVLYVYSGDDTAVVLDTDGKLKTLVFPEEYEVVSNTEIMLNEMRKTFIKVKSEQMDYEEAMKKLSNLINRSKKSR